MMRRETITAGTEETLIGCWAEPSSAATSSSKVAADLATDAGFLINRGKMSNHSTTAARLPLETCMRCVAVVVLAQRALAWPEIACSVPDMTPVKRNVTGVPTRGRGVGCGDDDALRRKRQIRGQRCREGAEYFVFDYLYARRIIYCRSWPQISWNAIVERNIAMDLQAAGSLLRSSWCLPIRGMFRCLELEKFRQCRCFCWLGGGFVQGCLVPEHVRLVPFAFSLPLSVRIIVRVCSATHAGAV